MNTGDDCYFFYNSVCSKGKACPFRHVQAARGAETICPEWRKSSCFKPDCPLLHSEIDKLRSSIPCYWENQPGGCQKMTCPFSHSRKSLEINLPPQRLSTPLNVGSTTHTFSHHHPQSSAHLPAETASTVPKISSAVKTPVPSRAVDPVISNQTHSHQNLKPQTPLNPSQSKTGLDKVSNPLSKTGATGTAPKLNPVKKNVNLSQTNQIQNVISKKIMNKETPLNPKPNSASKPSRASPSEQVENIVVKSLDEILREKRKKKETDGSSLHSETVDINSSKKPKISNESTAPPTKNLDPKRAPKISAPLATKSVKPSNMANIPSKKEAPVESFEKPIFHSTRSATSPASSLSAKPSLTNPPSPVKNVKKLSAQPNFSNSELDDLDKELEELENDLL